MNKAGRPKGTKKHGLKYLTDSELQRFNEALEEKGNLRNKLMMRLTLFLGLRVQELINIRMSDIEEESHSITIQGVKGGRIRTYSDLEPQLWRLLIKYIKRYKPTDHLFDVSIQTPKNVFKRYIRKAGLRHDLSIHSLRHTCGILKAKNNESPIRIMLWLRHRSVVSTQVYFEEISFKRDSQEMNSLMRNFM